MVYTQARENILVQDRRSWSGESLLIMVSSPPPFLLFFFFGLCFSFVYLLPPLFFASAFVEKPSTTPPEFNPTRSD